MPFLSARFFYSTSICSTKHLMDANEYNGSDGNTQQITRTRNYKLFSLFTPLHFRQLSWSFKNFRLRGQYYQKILELSLQIMLVWVWWLLLGLRWEVRKFLEYCCTITKKSVMSFEGQLFQEDDSLGGNFEGSGGGWLFAPARSFEMGFPFVTLVLGLATGNLHLFWKMMDE